ncbi:hypothetical protein GCM10007886_27590 [Methylobacterium gregans]|uniref:Uncharacterized protein n=1 Tax=Methylobacterium gregans TaxID=374424 RepID=A0AA37HNK4_9HYPH|nr:hypothetical protein [Methylobacterium gregans]GJD78082.1 hypothetical protein NBEOAGPD_1294 [Methylobacterium gregans]GLS54576.1 hypothetical protein GCM10007886_27590 [Methylobacterium gregans]
MLKNAIQPPLAGPNRNPVLYGVANGLAKLFPPVEHPENRARESAAPRPAPRPARG